MNRHRYRDDGHQYWWVYWRPKLHCVTCRLLQPHEWYPKCTGRESNRDAPRWKLWRKIVYLILVPCGSPQLFQASTRLLKIWGFHCSDYEECRLLGYKDPVCTSQETHYLSATESSQLMLCKIWGFHCSDYVECRLLGYKDPVCTSQETHYLSATESSQLMLCKIWGFHGSNYVEWRLLWCYAVWLLLEPTFRRNVGLPSSGWQESVN
jgi:hypothetical protein